MLASIIVTRSRKKLVDRSLAGSGCLVQQASTRRLPAMEPERLARASKLKAEIRLANAQRRKMDRAIRDGQRSWSDWRRNKRLVVAQCVMSWQGINCLTVSALRGYLAKELIASGHGTGQDDCRAFLEGPIFSQALRDRVEALRMQNPTPSVVKEAGMLLSETRAMVRIASETDRGLSLSAEQVSEMLIQEDVQFLPLHGGEAAQQAAQGNRRKKLLRRLRSRWGLHYGTLMQRASVHPQEQRERVAASL